MKKVEVRFRSGGGGITAILTEEEALALTAAFEQYQEDKIDRLIDLPCGKVARIQYLESMQDVPDAPITETPQIEEALRRSIEDDADPTRRALKESQLKIFRHNRRCVAEGRMANFIWYKVEAGKLIQITRPEADARHKAFIRKQLTSHPRVAAVVEQSDSLAVQLVNE